MKHPHCHWCGQSDDDPTEGGPPSGDPPMHPRCRLAAAQHIEGDFLEEKDAKGLLEDDERIARLGHL